MPAQPGWHFFWPQCYSDISILERMPMTLKRIAVLAAAAGIAGPFIAPAQAAAPDKLYSMLAPSVWRVIAVDKDKKPFAQGSAVVIAPEMLLTNCHVLKGAR